MKIYDITRPVTPALAGWPGDTKCDIKPAMSIENGDSVNVSALTMSTHCGTHTDAPHHFIDEAERMEEVDLAAYLGPVTVFEIKDVDGPLRPKHLQKLNLANTQRLLIKTKCSELPDDQWPESFVYPTPETAEWLMDQGLWLFGTDAPTIDPVDSKTLEAHKVFYHGGVAILEGLQLKDVKPGKYELIALPLKLNGDGAPVRAILRR